MFVLQVMSAAMEFVPLVCLSLVTWSGITSADGPQKQILTSPSQLIFTFHPQTDDGVPVDCEVHDVSPETRLQWMDSSGKVIPTKEPEVRESGGSYDIILQTTVTMSDYYHCVATQEETGLWIDRRQHVNVNRPQKQILTSPSQLIFTFHPQTDDGVPVDCEVHDVSPKTRLRWKDSSGKVIPAKEPEVRERGGSYDIILQTTVTKSDYYHCVATQEETGLWIDRRQHVNVNKFPYGMVAGLVGGAVVVAVVITAVVCVLINKHKNRGSVV